MDYVNYTNDMQEVEMPYEATIQLAVTLSNRRDYLINSWIESYEAGCLHLTDWSKRIQDLNDAELALQGKVKVKY